jgi:protein-tyrosine-phosphatase
MADGLLRHDAGDRFEIESAGTKPSVLRQDAIAVMRELNMDISGHRSKSVEEFDGQQFDYVITVCDSARKIALCSSAPSKSCITLSTMLQPSSALNRSDCSGASATNFATTSADSRIAPNRGPTKDPYHFTSESELGAC